MAGESEDARIGNRTKACMIEYGGYVVCVDPSLRILDLIGKKNTMLIIGIIGNRGERKNFNEILKDIPYSSSTIIARRLKELQANGLIEKVREKGRISYRLTDMGWSVREALQPLLKAMESMPIHHG